MVCPLRVVLVAISSIIAVIALMYTLKDDEPEGADADSTPKEKKPLGAQAWEFANGQYLIDFYNKHPSLWVNMENPLVVLVLAGAASAGVLALVAVSKWMMGKA